MAGWSRREVALLDFARTLDDPRSPPGNRLEQLGADQRGQYSVRTRT